MGADTLIPAVAGEAVNERLGDALHTAHREEYAKLRDECEPFEGARELLAELRRRGVRVILATSSNEDDIDHFLGKLDARELVDGYTTSDDVERTKPHPDLLQAALAKAAAERAVVLGDSPWDVEAAGRAGLETVALLSGGFPEEDLRAHGAAFVFESLLELRAHLDETPLAGDRAAV
jgi:HAD superfamily hydrolase (TIGR01549 family)